MDTCLSGGTSDPEIRNVCVSDDFLAKYETNVTCDSVAWDRPWSWMIVVRNART